MVAVLPSAVFPAPAATRRGLLAHRSSHAAAQFHAQAALRLTPLQRRRSSWIPSPSTATPAFPSVGIDCGRRRRLPLVPFVT
ncbi:hypothetical protein MTO96_047700 [Rhipicephalus appendiculatus]